jgi:hypothetical protein
MDDLHQLVSIISDLPQLTIWVLLGFAIYKTFIFSSVTGSLYYGFKFAVNKWSEHKREPTPYSIDDLVITSDSTKNNLIVQLSRICGKRTGIDSTYIHSRSVEWLKEAIDAKELKERESKK